MMFVSALGSNKWQAEARAKEDRKEHIDTSSFSRQPDAGRTGSAAAAAAASERRPWKEGKEDSPQHEHAVSSYLTTLSILKLST